MRQIPWEADVSRPGIVRTRCENASLSVNPEEIKSCRKLQNSFSEERYALAILDCERRGTSHRPAIRFELNRVPQLEWNRSLPHLTQEAIGKVQK